MQSGMARDWRDERIADLEATVARQHATVELQQAMIAKLQVEVAELRARLDQNSSNSSKPPSADPPAARDARPPHTPTGRKPGGQPGHKRKMRALLPADQVTRTVDHYPPHCGGCGKRLPKRSDGEVLRHQLVELPPITPDVTEHRSHCVECPDCGKVNRAVLPEGVPRGMCGPRLLAVIALLTGVFGLSRRQGVQCLGDILGIRISLGGLSESEERVSEAIAAPVEEVREYACAQRVKHIDATSWRQGRAARTLWTIATKLATVYMITSDATEGSLRALFGRLRGILVSDRGSQFGFWAMRLRQICWAHLIRKFVAFSQHRDPRVARLGGHLLLFAQVLLHQWHQVRDGPLTRAEFQRTTINLRLAVENLLQQGVDLGVRGVSGSCANILKHRLALWTFIDTLGVEPTNNHAESELRPFVLWRRKSFGTQSERGNRFAERVMTVARTLRKQNRHVLSYLTDACTAALHGRPAPSLLPSHA